MAKTQSSIANVFQQQGQYPKALEMYQKSLATSTPVVATTNLSIGAAYNEMGDSNNAMARYVGTIALF